MYVIQGTNNFLQWLKAWNDQFLDYRHPAVKFGLYHFFDLSGFTKPHWNRGTTIAYVFGPSNSLGNMKVTQSKVINRRRKHLFTYMGQRADVQFSYTVAINSFTSSRKKMSHGNNRHSGITIFLELNLFVFCQGTDIRIMIFKAVN